MTPTAAGEGLLDVPFPRWVYHWHREGFCLPPGAIGLAEVRSTNPDFLRDVRAQGAVKGAARDQSVATVRPGMGHKFADERLDAERAAARSYHA